METVVNEKRLKLENMLDSLAIVASKISIDAEMTPFCLMQDDYSRINALKKLKLYEREAELFEELTISLNNSENLYTCSGIVSKEMWIQNRYRPVADYNENELQELLYSKAKYGCTLEGQAVIKNRQEYSIITYPLGEARGHIYGTLIGVYPTGMEGALDYRLEDCEKSIGIVCTNDLEFFYTQLPEKIRLKLEEDTLKEELGSLLMDWEEGQRYYEFELLGVNYVGKIVRLDVNGWYMIDMVEEHVVTSDFWIMQLPLLCFIFLAMLVLVILLSVVLSMYNYLPIQRLYHLFDRKASDKEWRLDQPSEKDELLFLNEYIRNLIEEQSVIQDMLETNNRISRMELTRMLLRSSMDVTLPKNQDRLLKMGINLDKRYMAAAVIKLLPEEMSSNWLEQKLAQYESAHEDIYLTENIFKEYYGLLVCMDEQGMLEEIAGCLAEQLGDTHFYRIGFGDIYEAPESLKYSLMEAVIAVESGRKSITRFADITTQKRGEIYCKPLEGERKLKQLLVQGAAEKLEMVLKELHNELLYIWQSDSEIAVYFLMNRIFGFLFEDALSLDENMAERYLHYSNLEEFLENLREFCRVELDCRLEKNASREDLRIMSIIAFVDENYMNQEMSLTLVAEKFHMTVAYLSRIFKAAIGKTFINYIMEKRLELAAQLLLETDDTIGEIVEKVGYCDTSSFIRKFTRHFMVSPGAYRKMQRENLQRQKKMEE